MNGHFVVGMSAGVGIGWLNATLFGIPDWSNILLMGVLAIVGEMMRRVQ